MVKTREIQLTCIINEFQPILDESRGRHLPALKQLIYCFIVSLDVKQLLRCVRQNCITFCFIKADIYVSGSLLVLRM